MNYEFEPKPNDGTLEVNNIFCSVTLTGRKNGTLYTNATGVLPAMPLDGHHYYLIMYNYK